MWPTSFESSEPLDISEPGLDGHRWRWKLRNYDGELLDADITISRTAETVAEGRTTEGDLTRAVASKGRSVIEAHVLSEVEPKLRWIVGGNDDLIRPSD